ncbi:MAG: copper chaperone PCu(A)C [Gallionella sp.]
MQKISLYWVALVASLLSVCAYAGDIQVDNAFVHATAPGQTTAMGDFSITSPQAASLVGVSTPAAQSVELHMMMHDKGMMMMHEVDAIDLPAGKTVDLRTGGYHLMLIGLKNPIKEETTVPLTLLIQLANKKIIKVDIAAKVKPLIATDGGDHMHMHY